MRHFSIEKLSDEDRQEFDRLIMEGKLTQAQLSDWLRERGIKLAASGVCRYSLTLRFKLRDPAKELRASVRCRIEKLSVDELATVDALLRRMERNRKTRLYRRRVR